MPPIGRAAFSACPPSWSSLNTMKTYLFDIELEPDQEGWRAFHPPLEDIGASTWGKSKEEALNNIQEVLSLILDELSEEEKPLAHTDGLTVSDRLLVAVTR
jgi:predicted RNase H-like HicB family nuclease